MISRDLLIYYAGKAIPSLANLLIIILGVRWLGEAGYGSFNLIYNAALVATSFVIGWLQQSSLRFLPGQKDGGALLSKQYYGFGQWTALAAFLITSVFCFSYLQLYWIYALIAGTFAALWSLFTMHLTLLQSRFSAMSFALTESAYNLLIIAALFSLLSIDSQASSATFLIIFCSSALLTLIVAALRGRWSLHGMRIDPNVLKQAIKYGFPLTIWLFVSNLFNITDRFFISHYLGDSQTGIYASVYDLIYKLAALCCFPILLSKHPSIAAAWNNKAIENTMSIIRQSLCLQAIILVFMLLGGIFMGEWLIHTFLKIDVPNYYFISIPLILSSVIWQMALLIHKPLEMAHKSSQMIVFILLSLVMNCILNVILIPRYGMAAAGFTTLFSTLLYVTLTLIAARNILIKLR